jgi:hypothetical protein
MLSLTGMVVISMALKSCATPIKGSDKKAAKAAVIELVFLFVFVIE